MFKICKIGLWICWSGLGLLAAATEARASGEPVKMDAGLYFNVGSSCHGAKATLGPWYAYFPYEAHFQTPAPVGLYPHWPVPFPQMPTAQPAGTTNPPPQQRQAAPPPRQTWQPAPSVQPVGYYGMQVPSYWYGR